MNVSLLCSCLDIYKMLCHCVHVVSYPCLVFVSMLLSRGGMVKSFCKTALDLVILMEKTFWIKLGFLRLLGYLNGAKLGNKDDFRWWILYSFGMFFVSQVSQLWVLNQL